MKIIGSWLQERGRLNRLPLLKDLRVVSNHLNAIFQTLEGGETGFHSSEQVEVVVCLRQALATVPAIGSINNAHATVQQFRELTNSMMDAARVAIDKLKQEEGNKGRPSLGWYDDFAALLVAIARKAGTDPTLNVNRIT